MESVQNNQPLSLAVQLAKPQKGGLRSLSRWLSKRYHRKNTEADTQTDISSISTKSKPEIEAIVSNNKSLTESGNNSRMDSIRKRSRTSQIQLLDESWEDWQERYQKGSLNLSEVGRPTCFNGFGHMTAPLHRNEPARLRAVERIGEKELWSTQIVWLKSSLRKILTKYRLKSATVSVLERTTQQIMVEVGLGHQFVTIGRELSIDAHTVLSRDYFALLDASSDWRTRLNPLVHGPPFIKFYLGVPIVYKNMPIGSISVLDPYLKTRVSPVLLSELKELAEQLVRNLEHQLNHRRPWKVRQVNTESVPSLVSPPSQKAIQYPVLSQDSDSVISISTTSESSSLFTPFHPSQSQESLVISLANNKARIHPIPSTKLILQPFEVFESLLKCPTISQAIKKACRMVMQNVGANIVYIAEVRFTEKCLFTRPALVNSNLADFDSAIQRVEKTVKARLAGSCKPTIDVIVDEDYIQRDIPLLEAAIPSKYGLKFTSEGNDQPMSGVMVPLRRSSPDLKVKSETTGEIRSGGFVMASFASQSREFSPGDCVFIKQVARALENIIACYDEIKN